MGHETQSTVDAHIYEQQVVRLAFNIQAEFGSRWCFESEYLTTLMPLDGFGYFEPDVRFGQSVMVDLTGMRSSTIWTTAWDLSGKTLYFHTQHNRRVRKVDLNKIDFSGDKIRHIHLDENKAQDTKDLTP